VWWVNGVGLVRQGGLCGGLKGQDWWVKGLDARPAANSSRSVWWVKGVRLVISHQFSD